MTESVKSKRKYNSTRRQLQAQETRKQIITAARQLFIRHGYTGATIEAIAQEAGVAPETIFAIYGSKRTILANLIGVAVGGDDQPIPLLQRSGPQAVLQEQDPVRQLHFFAEDMTSILERVAPVFEVMHMAAKTEPDIAELLKKLLEERLRNLTEFAQRVSSHVALRDGLDSTRAGEIIWAISSPEMFNLLTVDRGWPKSMFAAWLGDALVRLLLP